jgi:uncharacterized protein YbaP (TraB family)
MTLADKLPEALPKAFEAAQAIQAETDRVLALTALTDKLPEALLPKGTRSSSNLSK